MKFRNVLMNLIEQTKMKKESVYTTIIGMVIVFSFIFAKIYSINMPLEKRTDRDLIKIIESDDTLANKNIKVLDVTDEFLNFENIEPVDGKRICARGNVIVSDGDNAYSILLYRDGFLKDYESVGYATDERFKGIYVYDSSYINEKHDYYICVVILNYYKADVNRVRVTFPSGKIKEESIESGKDNVIKFLNDENDFYTGGKIELINSKDKVIKVIN